MIILGIGIEDVLFVKFSFDSEYSTCTEPSRSCDAPGARCETERLCQPGQPLRHRVSCDIRPHNLTRLTRGGDASVLCHAFLCLLPSPSGFLE